MANELLARLESYAALSEFDPRLRLSVTLYQASDRIRALEAALRVIATLLPEDHSLEHAQNIARQMLKPQVVVQ
jgi:hypothetical protein